MGTLSTFDNADLISEAFEQCGIAPDQVSGMQARSARRSLGLLFAEWDNKGVNLWKVGAVTVPLVAGSASYALPASTIAVLDCYTTPAGQPDVLMAPISRSEYAGIPAKSQTGRPTSFWFNRAIVPSLTLWPVPDGAVPYTLTANVWQAIDWSTAQTGGASVPDVPQRWWSAMASGLAAKLAIKYAPERAGSLQVLADRYWAEASREDRERVPLRFLPGGSYR